MKYFLIILFINLNAISFAATYFVSPTGSNANTGIIYRPFKTISYGLKKLKAGDILYVRTGNYEERIYMYSINGAENKYITIQAYPGESPVIDGKGIDVGSGGGLVQIGSNYITFSGFEVKTSSASGIVTSGSSSNITISHCNVHDCWDGGIGISSNYSIVEYCTVYNVSLENEGGGTSSYSAALSARQYPQHCIL